MLNEENNNCLATVCALAGSICVCVCGCACICMHTWCTPLRCFLVHCMYCVPELFTAHVHGVLGRGGGGCTAKHTPNPHTPAVLVG